MGFEIQTAGMPQRMADGYTGAMSYWERTKASAVILILWLLAWGALRGLRWLIGA